MVQIGLSFDLPRTELPIEELQGEVRAVAEALEWGRPNARRIDDLAEQTGIPPRRVQELVQVLLLDHRWPIGTAMSPPFGNYLIDSAEELEQTVELLRCRGLSNLTRAAALKRMDLARYLDAVQTSLLEEDGP